MGSRTKAIIVALAIIAATIVGAWLTVSRALWPAFVLLSFAAGVTLFFNRRAFGRLGVATILLLAVVARLGVVAVPPTLSDDAYRFVWDAHLAERGINVYEHVPADSALDHITLPLVRERMNSSDYYSVYPPVSQLAFRLGTSLIGARWPAGYYGLKSLLLLAELGALLLLARLCTPANLALYALNPVVVVEVAAQAHTEALLLPLLAGLIFLSRRLKHAPRATPVIAGMLTGGATLVKLYPILWLPSVVRRFGLASLAGFLLAAVAVAAPFYSPVVVENVRSSLDLYVRLFEFNAGPYYLMKGAMRLATGNDWSKQIGPVLQWLFLVAAAGLITVDLGRFRTRVPLERVLFWLLAAFLVCATTVHPWYFVPLVALYVLDGKRSPGWLWLAGTSTGTYLLYSHDVYWPFVYLGWIGWIAILSTPALRRLGQGVLRLRARRKASRVLPFIGHTPDTSVLDLGCGEGYVGEAIRDVARCDVTLMDVVDYTNTMLPFVRVDGAVLPLDDASVDYVVMYYVLHHADDAEQLIREAMRVTRKHVLIVESTYSSELGRRVLLLLDRVANYVRSRGAISEQPIALKKTADWVDAVEREGGTVEVAQEFGSFPHLQALIVVSPGR